MESRFRSGKYVFVKLNRRIRELVAKQTKSLGPLAFGIVGADKLR